MGCFAPSSVASTWLTTTATTTTANLSVPANPPDISNKPAIPRPTAKAPRKPFRTWVSPTPFQLHFLPQSSQIDQMKIGMELSRKKERGWRRL